MSDVQPPPLAQPPPFTKLLRDRVVGFGVTFLVGLSPFLGKLRVPFFSPLLDMYPKSLQAWLIPVSGLFMGAAAVTLEFASEKTISQRKLTRWFLRTMASFAAALLLLIMVYVFVVARVNQTVAGPKGQPEETSAAFVTGTLEVPRQRPGSACRCTEGQPAEQCIEDVSEKLSNIKTCFGSQRVALASVALALLYVTLTTMFVAVVGLGLLSSRAGRPPRAVRRRSRTAGS